MYINIPKLICISFFFCCFYLATAQKNCNDPFPPGETCALASVLCDLDGYCFSNQSFQSAPTPASFCGQIENDGWVAFRAFTTFLIIEITVTNCISDDDERGVQAAMFSVSDCNNFGSGYQSVSNCLNPVSENTSDRLIAGNLTPGNIYHILIDGKGGDNCDIEFTVIDGLTSPVAEVASQSYLCENSILTLGSEATSLNSYNYQWTTDVGNFLTSTMSPNTTVDRGGNYTLVITDPDNGCIDSTSINVLDLPLPDLTIAPVDTLNCRDALTVFLEGSATNTDAHTGSWEGDGIVSILNDGFSIEVDQVGTYIFTLEVDSTGCTSKDTVMVFADVNTPFAVAGEGGELNCLTETITLDGSASSMGSDFIYQWSSSTGNFLDATNIPVVDVNAEGVYNLLITNTLNGCTASDEVLVSLNDAVPTAIEFNVNNPCFGETDGELIIEYIEGGTPPFLYQLDNRGFSENTVLEQLAPNTYQVTVQDLTGCELDTMITINSSQELIVDLGEDREIELGDSIQITAFINLPYDSIIWSSNVSEICTACTEFTILPLADDAFMITVTDENNCTQTASIIINVTKKDYLYIPNAFSPNNDGLNDVFMILGGKDVAQINRFEIYDRWGEQLFTQSNFPPNDPQYGWDGNFRNKNINDQVFTWIAEVAYIDGVVEIVSGDVTLLK